MKKPTKYVLVGLTGALVIGWNTWGLNYMVNKEVSPVIAYYSADEIPAGTQITEKMINEREVPLSSLPPNAITDKDKIIGKYTLYGYGVPANSYFFDEKVLTKDEMPNASVLKLKAGELAFPLLVDLESSLGNGIVPDTQVDLAFRGFVVDKENGEKRPIYGVIAENVRVTSVKDSNASAVFNDDANRNQGDQERSLTKLFTFAVDNELNDILNKATLLGEVRPVAKGESQLESLLSTDEIIAWLESQSYNPAELLAEQEKNEDLTMTAIEEDKE